MATAAVQLDDKALVLSEVEKLDLPKGVRFKKAEPAVDWEGDPIWEIFFAVSKSIPLTKRRMAGISVMREKLVRSLLDQNLSGFPIVRFLDAR